MRPVIVSTKHYIQFTEFNVASAAVSERVLAQAVAVKNKDIPDEVEEGAIVKAVFIELWLSTDAAAASGSFVVIVEKVEGSQAAPSLSEMTSLNAYSNKKNILFTSQGILAGESHGNPTPVLRQWLKIPKGKQRMGLTDQIRMNVAAIGADQLVGCSFATYKEYL